MTVRLVASLALGLVLGVPVGAYLLHRFHEAVERERRLPESWKPRNTVYEPAPPEGWWP